MHAFYLVAEVLDHLVSMVISEELMSYTLDPQAIYSHDKVKTMLEDIVLSSMLRIEADSLNKLWVLSTMIFKWQLTHSQDLIKLTLRHLYELEKYITEPDTQHQLSRVQHMVRNYTEWGVDPVVVRETLLDWMGDFKSKVMILMKLGFQDNKTGEFIMNNNTPMARDLLEHLGENIFVVTLNGDIGKRGGDVQKIRQVKNSELKSFIQQLQGDNTKRHIDNDANVIYTTKLNTVLKEDNKLESFMNIDVPVQKSNVSELFNDVNVNDSNLTDDLLEMIGQEELNT